MYILTSCGDLNIPDQIVNIVSTIINLIKIAIPVILIIFGMLDLGKAVMAQKEDEIKQAQNLFVKRIIAAVIVFLVIAVVQLIMGLIGENDAWQCACEFMGGNC